MWSPKTPATVSSARGPCTANGETSGSSTTTSRPIPVANPLAQSSTSESEMDSQKWSPPNLRMTGSLIMPAFSSTSGAYRHLPRPRPGDVPRGHHLQQPFRVRPLQFHLALAAHVPDLDILPQVPVVFLQGAAESLGQDHVIDDGIVAYPEGLHPLDIGGDALAAGRGQPPPVVLKTDGSPGPPHGIGMR